MIQINTTAADFVETKIQSLESYVKQRRCIEAALEAKGFDQATAEGRFRRRAQPRRARQNSLRCRPAQDATGSLVGDDLAEMGVSPDPLENAHVSLEMGRGERVLRTRRGTRGENSTVRSSRRLFWSAYLVPWLLNGGDLDYLFGITDGSAILSDSADAISLHTRIESALDNAEIVIVPRLEAGKETEWEVFVTDESELGDAACLTAESGQTKCKNFHQRTLQFLTSNGPSKRYLYFRFVKSYLIARKVSDKYPPPGLVDANTFDELPYDPP
ncbi:uncharacterized protein L3040_000991 [Drepanopeziza brunnea f. sp. 'multigermtubi']|uniref:uncharacterized protein n=1 Tax=Drepanopeziza brunnea f. sp. 'multigermtubi' TaxID=698441 RepID=UPI00239F923E|nr:hypothetical protein L3040_000991 [Drepanopeziza brunnea f. sp. 'multigermtubi']